MTITASTRPESATPHHPYLSGNWAPVQEEITAVDLDVTGNIPRHLDGRYLRIGPNPLGDPDPKSYHMFLGAGMAHGLRLRDGKAQWYRNRWNGVGLPADHPEGFGLRGMRARVAEAGGTMSVSRTPGGGATIEVEVPT